MGRFVAAVPVIVLRVGRHDPGVHVHGERADVAEHDKHGHCDEQPGRETPDVHEIETSEHPGILSRVPIFGTIRSRHETVDGSWNVRLQSPQRFPRGETTMSERGETQVSKATVKLFYRPG